MLSFHGNSFPVGAKRLLAAMAMCSALLTAERAEAGLLVDTTTACESEAIEHPFIPWADPAPYTLVPQGSLGSGASEWRLADARVVAENEPFRVHGDRQPAALRIEAGGSASSKAMCVGVLHPTLRFFARNDGSSSGALKVEAMVRDSAGQLIALPIGEILGHREWAPTLPLPVMANLLPLLPDQRTLVAFRFTATGTDGAWLIDDVYVDPYSKG